MSNSRFLRVIGVAAVVSLSHAILASAAEPTAGPVPPGCESTPSNHSRLSSKDVVPPNSPTMLLENLKLAALSHWFEKDEFYDESFLKGLLGVTEIERTVVNSPGNPQRNPPPSTVENFRGRGKMTVPAKSGSSARTFEYRVFVGRALTGEIVNHYSRVLALFINDTYRPDAAEYYWAPSYADVSAVFGTGAPIDDRRLPRPSDAGVREDKEVFYRCEALTGAETLTGQFTKSGTLDTLEFDVATH